MIKCTECNSNNLRLIKESVFTDKLNTYWHQRWIKCNDCRYNFSEGKKRFLKQLK